MRASYFRHRHEMYAEPTDGAFNALTQSNPVRETRPASSARRGSSNSGDGYDSTSFSCWSAAILIGASACVATLQSASAYDVYYGTGIACDLPNQTVRIVTTLNELGRTTRFWDKVGGGWNQVTYSSGTGHETNTGLRSVYSYTLGTSRRCTAVSARCS